MKKFSIIFSIFLLLTFNMNIATVKAAQTFSEGVYSIKDLNLMQNVQYSVQNTSQGSAFMIIFDGNQMIQQSIRFEPNSIKYSLRPMQYDYKIVVIGTG